MNTIFSLIAIVSLLALAFILSADKKKIKLQTVIMGLLLQTILIFFVIKVPIGQFLLEKLALSVNNLIQMGMEVWTLSLEELLKDMCLRLMFYRLSFLRQH